MYNIKNNKNDNTLGMLVQGGGNRRADGGVWFVVHQSDGQWTEAVPVSGGFGVQGSVAPTRGEELEQLVSGV